MFGWFAAKSPLGDDQCEWIHSRFHWLLDQFGQSRLNSTVITPTDEFFPEPYGGTTEDAAVLFDRVCRYMGVSPARVELSFYSATPDAVASGMDPSLRRDRALGLYVEEGTRAHIWLETERLREPLSVVATFAHELGHVHLLGDRRYSREFEDHEPLTDLLTVFFGMGIFTANSTIFESKWQHGSFAGWSISREGYMTGAHYAYALAIYAAMRCEPKPAWRSHLRPDIRAWMKTEGRGLAKDALNPVQKFARFSAFRKSTENHLLRDDEASVSEESAQDASIAPTVADEPRPDDEIKEEHGNTSTQIRVPSEKLSADEWFTSGILHAQNGNPDLAVSDYSKALQIEPSDTEIWLYRARAFIDCGEYAKAVQDCARILEHDANDVAALRARGTAYVYLRQYDAALADLTQALRTDHEDPESYLMRGLSRLGLRKFSGAATDFDQAIRFAPTWGINYLARSRAYKALGKSKRASADLAEALRRDPELADESVQADRLAGITI